MFKLFSFCISVSFVFDHRMTSTRSLQTDLDTSSFLLICYITLHQLVIDPHSKIAAQTPHLPRRMQPDTMLNIDCCHMDKDFGNTITQDEDPGDDFFEQWLNQDPPTISDTAAPREDFHNYDFAIDEETGSSGSYSTESKATSLSSCQRQPEIAKLHASPPQLTAPLQSQPPHTRCEAPTLKGAISSTELLNLEGKLFYKRRQPKAPLISSSSSPAVPAQGGTLRRKAKFCAPTPDIQRGRPQKVLKSPSNEMMRPSYQYRQETPGCHEWTQRFEQISLQTPNNTPQISPSRNKSSFRDNRPSRIVTSTREFMPQHPKDAMRVSDVKSAAPRETSTTPQASYYKTLRSAPILHSQMSDAEFNSMPSTSGEVDVEEIEEESERGHARRLRHPPSWNHLPISPFDLDLSTMSPSHVQPSWLQRLPVHVNVGSYQHNSSATHSTPSEIAQPTSDYVSQGFLVQYEPYGHFVNEDPSTSYSIVPSNPLRSPGTEGNPIALYGDVDDDSNPARTDHAPNLPRLRSQSVSAPLHNHHHNHHQSPTKSNTPSKSRSHKKTKSVGQLKQPKSCTTLKGAKSFGNIKSPTNNNNHKSTTTATTKTASAGGGAGAGGASSAFDNFVNFTAHDSDRILTGVAPSGSSKTKARREQEANEKKRKLSMAAVRMVEEAGGDVNAMEMLKAEFDE